MNYIRHLSAFYMKAAKDERLKPAHISLYHALFQLWNLNRFEKPIFINRSVLVRYTKIGSNHTLYRCLEELDRWKYIKYLPSFSPKKGTYVHLFSFDIGTPDSYADFAPDLCKNDIGTCAESTQVRCKNDIGTCAKMHSYINNSNINNIKSGREDFSQANISNDEMDDFKKKEQPFRDKTKKELKRKKVALKKENEISIPTLDVVMNFFQVEKYPDKEAKKFFYYFESNGWRVGGKTPMKDWSAAAHHWMLNVGRYDNEKVNPLIINKQKNYDEPL